MDSNDASSPGSLSSPPHSPEGTPSASVRPSASGVGAVASTPTPAATSPAPRGLTASGQPRKKPGPKPKAKDSNGPEPEKKPRKPRKPAEPKDAAQPVQRKRRTKASLDAQTTPTPQAPEEKLQVHHSPTPQAPPQDSVPVAHAEPQISAPAQPAQVLNNPEPGLHNNPNLSHIKVAPATPRPSSSGQRYDPIRGGLFESKPQAPACIPQPVSPPLNRASASPSITSLIDPPSASNTFYTHPQLQQQQSVTSAPASPAGLSMRHEAVIPPQDAPSHLHQKQPPPPAPSNTAHNYSSAPPLPTAMEIDSDNAKPTAAPMTKTSSTHSTPAQSNAPTPPVKTARQKEAPPPLPTGSGLLSGTPFGPTATTNGGQEAKAPNIWLSFNLKGRDNVTINFAQEVEKRYGFAALHPRIAARKERQRQITAAGAALEKAAGGASNDDMSLDMSENESNAEMGGMDDETSALENGAKKRRKRKQEDYDKEDEFIDDTELAWEQQALMAKDGFFVYSGPLVTEEKPAIERADGTVRRGRGRGRGSSARGDATGRGRGRGGGPGSRGGTTVRKPRVTKADRAQMEQEKKERESIAANLAAKQPLATATGANGAA